MSRFCLSRLYLLFAFATGLPAPALAQISDDVIKIGVITDMNGPLSSAGGRGSVEAAQMAAEEFGGSIDGKRIEIVAADHQNKPDIGAAIARRWFEVEHVDAIADIASSSVGFAIVELARVRNKVVLVSGPGSVDFTGKACAPTSIHWTWDTYAAAAATVSAVFAPERSTWFIVTDDLAFGHALERDAERTIEKLGGKVIEHVRVPFGTADFSSFLLRAQQSKAQVVAFATAGQDTVNLVKQASEFGLARSGLEVVPLQLMLDEVKAIGLPLGQGASVLMAFDSNRSAEAAAWSKRYFDRMNALPTAIQAGTYSAVRHYLQAVKDAGTDEPLATVAKMKATPVNDMFATGGFIRDDGRMVHDMYLVRIKSPAESGGPWDLVKIVKTIPGSEAFRPLSESDCPLLKK